MNLDKIRDFLESEEGKKSMDEFCKKMAIRDNVFARWVEKFKKWAEPDMDLAIEKLLNKYDSSEYIQRELYKRGCEPREPFLWLALEYAYKYCEPCEDEKYLNMFTGEAYYIGSYVIQVMNGQGSVIRIDKVENDSNEL